MYLREGTEKSKYSPARYCNRAESSMCVRLCLPPAWVHPQRRDSLNLSWLQLFLKKGFILPCENGLYRKATWKITTI